MVGIYNTDCIEGAKLYLPDSCIDLMICDPPFGINETTFDNIYNRDSENVISGYQEAPEDYYTFSKNWIQQASRVLKPNGSMYIVSGWSNLRDILNVVHEEQLEVINHIIWKYNFGVYTKNKYVSSHYHILYLKKTKKSSPTFNRDCEFSDSAKDLNGGSRQYAAREDVWLINKEYRPGEIKNSNKLPDALVEKMIKYSSNPGDVVCDFFLGNFTTAVCADKLHRIYCGFEINEKAYLVGISKFDKVKNP